MVFRGCEVNQSSQTKKSYQGTSNGCRVIQSLTSLLRQLIYIYVLLIYYVPLNDKVSEEGSKKIHICFNGMKEHEALL
jgi:hypothetical protein